MTTIYLVRHAEAEGNLYRRIHGQFESRVTAKGLRQIEALERRFADIPVQACYSSDFIRTQTTAKAVWVPKGLLLQLDPGFREVGLGVWENREFGWLYTFEAADMAAFNQDPAHWHVENSESYEAYTARFIQAMTRAAEDHAGETIAIFTHGAVLRGVQLKLFPDQPISHCDNTAVSLLRYENGRYTFDYLNDNSHLNGENSTLARQNWWRGGGKEDLNLWFRTGMQPLPGMESPQGSDTVFTAMLGEIPAGVVCLSDGGGEIGRLDYLALLPEYRGKNLAIQLVGQAVFHFRAQGKTRLQFQIPQGSDAFETLCRRLILQRDAEGTYEMEIGLM